MRIIKIGHSSNNDIVINDPTVSRTHCQIIQDDYGVFRLIDINSTNGTFVNGIRRQGEITLNRGDIIRIGNTTLPWESYFLNAGGGQGYGGRTQMQPAAGGNNGGNGININLQNMNDNGFHGGYAVPQQPVGGKPDNFLVWSILATILCCLPFGIIAIVYSSKVNSLWYEGKYDEARKAASNARGWFWAAFFCGLISSIGYIIYVVAIMSNYGGF